MERHLIPRLFIKTGLMLGQCLTLNNEQAHYVQHVMRLKIGQNLRIFNGHDGEWLGTITSTTKKSIEISLQEQLRSQHKEPNLLLYCAPLKKAYFEYLIEKATELGVAAIHPILTERTQIREVNTNRCHALAIEAAEQSERLAIPHINDAIVLKKCLEEWPQGYTPVICAERGDAKSAHEVFGTMPKGQKTVICVGPEGGFTANEFEILRSLPHAQFIRLGPRILRADTAAIAALSCWQATCGDWFTSKNLA